MKNIIVGTAGHIDHGKTSLVRALTGIDTDRLQEEKRRGISIDLGFAHLKLSDSLQVAFIDVPGHERFIKNMLAGVGGIDLVLLVIAADESIKPQTREHLDICRLLRVPRGLVAVTKTDLVDEEIGQLVRLEIEEFVDGSFLEGAPVIGISSMTGAGLDELRDALTRIASDVRTRDLTQNFRMPVDRSFVMQGFGTVVTGTVTGGSVSVDSEIEIFPPGRRVRVRGIQVHGAGAKQAYAGQRAALNLAGVEVAEASRGAVLGRPDCFRMTKSFDAILELLPGSKPLKNRAPVHLHSGTSAVTAEVRIPAQSGPVTPGTTAAVRIVLDQPLILSPGDRFIVRLFSPVVTIGGGEVVDPFPPKTIRLRNALERTLRLAQGSLADRIATLAVESRGGLSRAELVQRTGATEAALEAAAPPSVLRISEPQPWFIDREWIRSTASRWHQQIAAYHRAHPLQPGISREEMRSRELSEAPAFIFDLVLAEAKTIRSTADVLHLVSHTLALKQDEEQALQRIEGAFASAGLSVPGVEQVLQDSGVDTTRARSLLQVLLRSKRLLRISEDFIFHPGAIAELHARLREAGVGRFTVSDFKQWTGVSRKYAIPLLEYLDRERVTRREGEFRVINQQ